MSMHKLTKSVGLSVVDTVHGTVKFFIPPSLRKQIQNQRIYLLYNYFFNKKLSQYIEVSNDLSEELVEETMRKHNLSSRWAGMFTALNGKPSNDYISEGFFFTRIVPRMNNLAFVKAYTDKNFYDLTPLGKYTIPVVLRKIAGRYYGPDYRPVLEKDIKSIIEAGGGERVIKPAIESGSGKDVWVGPVEEAYAELMRREGCKDIIIQPRMQGDAFSKSVNPTSFNSVRLMTVFTGSEYVSLGGAFRVGRGGAKVDNQSAGGIAVGVFEDGTLDYYATDKKLSKYEVHPDTGFVFRGQKLPHYERMKQTCLELHRYLPHFGIVSWDVTVDSEGAVRIIEINLDLVAFGLVQVPHGPLFGKYKDEIKKTYGLPDWEG